MTAGGIIWFHRVESSGSRCFCFHQLMDSSPSTSPTLLPLCQGGREKEKWLLAPLIHSSYDGEVWEYVHQVVERLRVELARKQVAWPFHAVPHARSSLSYMLQDDDNSVLDLPGNKKQPYFIKLTLIGNMWSQRQNYSTFALLLTWTLSSIDCGHLENC